MTMSAHFLLVKTTYSAEDYAKFYIEEMVRLRGAHVSIVSYIGSQLPHNSTNLSIKV